MSGLLCYLKGVDSGQLDGGGLQTREVLPPTGMSGGCTATCHIFYILPVRMGLTFGLYLSLKEVFAKYVDFDKNICKTNEVKSSNAL